MPRPQKKYLEAFQVCGKQLQACMDELGDRPHAWLKAEPRNPAFADLIFRVGNRVYAVLIVRVDHAHGRRGKPTHLQISLPTPERDLFLTECERYNLTPLFFPMWVDSMAPLSMGWNLLIPESGAFLDPADEKDLPQPVPMGEWELCNFRVGIVLQHLRNQNLQILSWQDIPDIRPHILFRAADNAFCWVIVTAAGSSEQMPDTADVNSRFPDSPDDIRGYVARVDFQSATHPATPPARGDSFFVRFNGLELL